MRDSLLIFAVYTIFIECALTTLPPLLRLRLQYPYTRSREIVTLNPPKDSEDPDSKFVFITSRGNPRDDNKPNTHRMFKTLRSGEYPYFKVRTCLQMRSEVYYTILVLTYSFTETIGDHPHFRKSTDHGKRTLSQRVLWSET